MRKLTAIWIFFIFLFSISGNILSAEETLPLTLQDVLGIAIVNNFDIQLAKYDRSIKETDMDDAMSIYDTVLKLESEYTHEELERATTLSGGMSEDYEIGLNLSKKLITGTDVDIDYGWLRHRTDSSFVQLNPSEESYIKFTFTQPILKNVLGINDWGDVRVTKIDIDNFRSETLDEIEKSLSEVELAYWELMLVDQMAAIRRDAREEADTFYGIVESKEEMGSAELTDLYAAKANLKTRSAELENVKSNLKTAENKLKLLMNNKEAGSSIRISPIGKVGITEKDISLAPALKTAFDNRRDYKRAVSDIEAKDIELMMKKNERWPQLDLEGSFKMNGIRRSVIGSIQDTFDETNTEYYAKATFSFPFEDREARSAHNKAKLEKAKALVELKKIEKTIVLDIDSKVKAVNTHRHRIKELSEAAELEKFKLQEEAKKYRYGRSDADRMTRFQQDYLDAELSLKLASRDYMKALIDLFIGQNMYLAERNLIAP
jgi:outer membrane protein TolC